jgi:hypothetical protein
VLAIDGRTCLFCEARRPADPDARTRKPLAGTGRGFGRACARLVLPVPIALGALLGQHHDLSARLVLLHAAMRLNDLIKVEGPADLDVERARHDLLGQFLERRQRLIYAYPVCSQNPEIRRALADREIEHFKDDKSAQSGCSQIFMESPCLGHDRGFLHIRTSLFPIATRPRLAPWPKQTCLVRPVPVAIGFQTSAPPCSHGP